MAGIYLHIPFCKTRCVYCDFYSTTQSEQKARYVVALCRELEMRKSYIKEEPVDTIYFGGGTPSQLNEEDFKQIFATIHRVYGMDRCTEVTLEANPDDLTLDYLSMLASLPFNRISLGIQTFNDETLRLLNRRHTSMQAVEAVRACRRAGFHNISIDLMYGLPGETMQGWESDLSQAVALNVEHISAYHLIYEEGTKLHWMLKQHQVEEIDEDQSVAFFAVMIERLTEAGFQHYEISNFCRQQRESLHNSSYWIGKRYLGCGPSAHSFDGESRQWNVSSITPYMMGIEKRMPAIEVETLDSFTRYNDFVITSLRTSWGLSLHRLKELFGEELYLYCLENAKVHLRSGKLSRVEEVLYLSKEGIFVSDGIMSDLLWVED